MKVLPDLLSVAQVTRNQSQKYLFFRLCTNYLSVILSCISLVLPISIGWLIIFLAGLMQAISIILRNTAKKYHNLSREAQRRALIENSFGRNIEDFNISDLYSEVGEKLLSTAREYDFGGNYYSSQSHFGYNRFKENIQESCFFSRNLIDLEKKRIKTKMIIMTSSIIIITFLLIIGFFDYPTNFKYILGGISIVLFFIINDDFEAFSNCNDASKLFKDVDQRLNNIKSIEELFSSFADYSAAALLSPPIPTYLYNKKRELLNNLWEEVRNPLSAKSNVSFDSVNDKKEISTTEVSNVDIDWVIKELKTKLIKSNNKIKHKISKIEGWSGCPVYEILFYEDSRQIYHLIVKFYNDSSSVTKELNYINKLIDTGTDLLCYTVCEGDFCKKNILVYYHATHRTQELMKTIKEHLESIFNIPNKWHDFCSNVASFITSVTNTFDKINGKFYSVSTIYDYIEKNRYNIPPSFILNLTGDSRFKFIEKDILISSKQSYPDIEMIDQLHIINASELRSIDSNDIKYEWVKIPIEVVYTYKLVDMTYVYCQIVNSNDYICIIIPTEIYQSKIISYITDSQFYLILNPSTTRFSPFNLYFDKTNNTESKYLKHDEIEMFLTCVNAVEVKLSTRHGDFHDRNILCSDNYFKIIDIGDIDLYPIAYDAVRLEVSILLSITGNPLYSDIDITAIYNNIILKDSSFLSENSTKIAMIIKAIRAGIDNSDKAKVESDDYLILFYLELLTQMGYSIFGFRKISSQIITLQNFLFEYITNKKIYENSK